MTVSPTSQENQANRQYLIDAFHQLYYHHLGWDNNHWQGFQIKQCPFDLMSYQSLIYQIQPRTIVQTGIAGGGSLLFFAHMLDMQNAPVEAKVIGIDQILRSEALKLKHPRIEMIQGNSTDPQVLAEIQQRLIPGRRLISLDSDHHASHVRAELEAFTPLLHKGDFLVVEDTNLNGHPVFRNFGPGPKEALIDFLKLTDAFQVCTTLWQNHLFSFHTWLERISEPHRWSQE